MDIPDIVASFLTGTYTVTRRAAVSYVLGRPIAGPSSTFTIQACVQPASGRDLLRLPEERRSIDTQIIYTDSELRTGAQGSANEADLVNIDGLDYECQSIEEWIQGNPSGSGPAWRVIAQAPR